MKIYKSYKAELKPNNKQKMLLKKHSGVARFVYNWALSERIKLYETEKKSISPFEQDKKLNALKVTEFPWMYEVSKCAPRQAIMNVGRAFDNFFRRLKKGVKGENVGFPKFKKKHKGVSSFYLDGSFHLEDGRIKLPRIGWVRLKEKDYIPNLPIKSVTISERAGHWFVSTSFEFEIPEQKTTGEVIGIDLGITNLIHTSNNEIFNNPKALKDSIKKLKRYQREISRKQNGSKRREESRKKIARLHYRISNARKDNIHKITTKLVKTKPSIIVIEDLSVKNMMQNHKIAQALADSSLGEVGRQLNYKTKYNSILLAQVPRFYPSSKTCNKCGNIKKALGLNERVYNCKVCGNTDNRDFNAAKNIRDYFKINTVGSTGINAHGQNVRPKGLESTLGGLVEV